MVVVVLVFVVALAVVTEAYDVLFVFSFSFIGTRFITITSVVGLLVQLSCHFQFIAVV